MNSETRALTGSEYDKLWAETTPFCRYNPGARHRRRIVLQMLKTISPKTLLDVGCGSAELLLAMTRRFPNIQQFAGADLSPGVIEANKKKLPQIQFNVLDIQTQKLSQQFDAVVCSEVVEHLEDRKLAFENLVAMVKPGGHLLVTCPVGKVYATEKHFGHTSHPTFKEMQELALHTSLKIVEAQNWGWPTYKALKWATNVNAEWSLKNFASGEYSPMAKGISSFLYWTNYFNVPSSPMGCQLFVLFQR